MAELNIIDAIKKVGFPKTSVLNDVSSIMSFIALKIISKERLSHDDSWGLDRSLGLFANLNVLPKSTTLSTYSYRVTRNDNVKLLKYLANIFTDEDDQGCFNLDFKSIPHWGDASVLEKHWAGSRGKALKSILSLIVENQDTGLMNYTDATPRHNNQSDTILDFVDFWKQGTKHTPKMLVFDSKLTTYENLNALNKDGIKFLTLRRRGQKLIHEALNIPKEDWRQIEIKNTKRKHNKLLIVDNKCKLRHYDGGFCRKLK